MNWTVRLFFVMVTVVLGLSNMCQALSISPVASDENHVLVLGKGGEAEDIHWDMDKRGTIEVLGQGRAPTDITSELQVIKFARQAAIDDAHHKLAETISSLRVDANTTVQQLETSDIRNKIATKTLVENARLVAEGFQQDSLMYILSVNMYGQNSLAEIVFNAVKPARIHDFPVSNYQPDPNDMSLEDVNTGVIIDARNLGVILNFSPRIYDDKGRIVYDRQYIDMSYAVSQGIVAYTQGVDMYNKAIGGQSRAGVRPIIVKALRIVDNGCNIVISTKDADKMLAQNAKWGILRKCSVVIAI